MSDPVLGTTGNPGAGEPEPVLPDTPQGTDYAAGDPEAIKAESMNTVTTDAVAGDTVYPGVGDGNDGPTGGSPAEGQPDLPENDLEGQQIDLDDDDRVLSSEDGAS